MTLIAVSMGSQTSKERFNTCRALLDYGFSEWKLVSPDLSNININSIDVVDGKKKFATIRMESNVSSVLVPQGSSGGIETKLEIQDFVEAPVEKGMCVGKVSFFFEGKELSSNRVVIDDDVEEMDFNFLLLSMMKDFFVSEKNVL